MPTPHPQGRSRHTDAENGLEDTGGDVEGLSEQHGVCEQPGGGAGQHGAQLGALTTRWAAGRSRRQGPRTRVADARCPTAEASTAP